MVPEVGSATYLLFVFFHSLFCRRVGFWCLRVRLSILIHLPVLYMQKG